MSDLAAFQEQLRRFSDERDWIQFHDPKSLVLALVGEVGELAELVQWSPADGVTALAQEEPLRTRLAEEMADVLTYLVLLADVTGIDLLSAAVEKLAATSARYPPDLYRGRAPGQGRAAT